ncbi:MAG TPA: SPOR domain-containing protein [Stellaceae bacterium]|nr:SPOR domain-containing protein [Stellaceae bacterium]
MLLLTLSLGVAGFGIATAIYLERPQPPPTTAPAQVAAALPMPAHDPLAAAAAMPSRTEMPPTAASLPAIEPQAGPPVQEAAFEPQAGPPVQEAALEPPPATPAAPPPAVLFAPSSPLAAEPAGSYWVEYGVFAGKAAALRLQAALDRHGLAAVIVETHGQDHRKLLRVRSAPLADPAATHAAVDTARRALRIAALLHRDATAAAPQFRVQFAAFAQLRQAAQLSRDLAESGIAATVSKVQRASGKAFYLVRSMPMPDRAQALALGERGRPLAKTGFLIERSPLHAGIAPQAAVPPPLHRLTEQR